MPKKNKREIKKIIAELERLAKPRSKPRFSRMVGLCSQISYVLEPNHPSGMDVFRSEYIKALETWKHYSGCVLYPVPPRWLRNGESGDVSIQLAAQRAYNEKMDVWSGLYGRVRRHLCAHLAKKFRKLLK